MPVHEVAESGFGSHASVYERSRPSYPPEVVTWLAGAAGITSGRRVIDLAAGTGKMTRLLQPLGAELVAVEPVWGMVEELRRTCPDVPTVRAPAEQLPFATASVDAVVVAQAFHWFDAGAALDELGRVLHPGGRLALVWNARDRTVPWVDAAWSIMDRVEKRAPWRNHENWRESALVDHPAFGPLHEATFRHEQHLTPEGLIDRFRGVSHLAVLPVVEQEAVLDEIRTLIATNPETHGRDTLGIPYRVDAYWCERRA